MNRRQPERGRTYAGEPPDHDPRPERRDEDEQEGESEDGD